ncbi:hypothetical protein CPB83DRAFT_861662 [Crepidotus variabilis]|uniref:DUF6534 domain-containing protein n=1 Tax=Crepidotus variabilis TaxID=179855 RepID=A0A9P6E856_9AGAR|nr:hypothetical protein CPB83DRAFT_861662 [Crepidotus variabilis]
MPVPATQDWTQPLDSSYGLVLIGTIVSAVLHGACIIQAFSYFRQYKNDRWVIKGMVVTTVAVDGIHLILVTTGLYHYLIRSFHTPERLEYLTWTELIEALCVGINAAIVQTYYTYRIYKLSNKNYVLCGFVLLMILGEVASGLAWVIMTMRMQTWQELLGIKPITISIDALACFIDVVISTSLISILQRSKTGFKRSDTMINKLIILVINTGSLTAVVAISSLISVIIAPEKMIYAAIYFSLGRLYTNSLLTTLNSRSKITELVDATELQVSSLTFGSGNPLATGGTTKNLNILVETSHITTQEGGHDFEKQNVSLRPPSGTDDSVTEFPLAPRRKQDTNYAW